MEEYISLSCEKCNFKLKTLKKNAGKKGKCPKCQHICVVPQKEYLISDIEKDIAELGLGEMLDSSGSDLHIREW